MKSILAKAVMVSWLASLAACGPEMATDEQNLGVADEPAQKISKTPKSVDSVQVLAAVDCTSTYSLSNNTSTSALQGSSSTWSCIYTLSVPAGATDVHFYTTGGSGDPDLYVKKGVVPTSDSYDCKSDNTQTVEQCFLGTSQGGTYYVRLYGFGSYLNVYLVGSYTGGSTTPTGDCNTTSALTNGVTKSGLSAGSTYWSCIYTLSVPASATSVTFTTSGGTGDADLYVKRGSVPTSALYDCKSGGSTNAETCTLTNLQAGTYYVRLYGYGAASSVSLVGQYR
ncbi:PPC domain-containing protein [Hyalangium versicolor]|uniref:PPC domain-containing protein n=1 Tax=Hyalangium versicolor TaxID=2861190 RepID=UPI001CCDCBB4|nr:PPC domain-containing protein [Hyalangium versicolor]